MLGLIIAAVISHGFFKAARTRGRNGWLWGFFAFISWFGGQISVAFTMGVYYAVKEQDHTDHMTTILGLSVVGAIGSVCALYGLLRHLGDVDDSKYADDLMVDEDARDEDNPYRGHIDRSNPFAGPGR